jgi:hypothetical protein
MNDLNQLMHARVDDERPDLDALLTGAVHQGRRLRRRRRIGYAGAGLAVAAIVAGAAVGTANLGGGTSTTELQPAATGPGLASSTRDSGSTVTPDAQRLTATSGSQSVPLSKDRVVQTPSREAKPLKVKLAGWTCGPAADEKFECFGPQGRSVLVQWRPAAQYEEWLTDPDRGTSGGAVLVSPHGAYFVVLQPAPGTFDSTTEQQRDLHDLAASIVWK